MNDDIVKKGEQLVKNAEQLLQKGDPAGAFRDFDSAASLYKKIGDNPNAASCYASAATCWNLESGERILFNSASRFQYAAEEATKYGNYEYARYLYHEAARLYERDGSTKWFSLCFYMSKVCERNHAWFIFTASKKVRKTLGRGQGVTIKGRIKYFFTWLLNSFLCLIWGYGEKPYRTLLVSLFIVSLSAIIFYMSGTLIYQGKVIVPSLFDSFYFSIVTFTTLGYGDCYTTGAYRLVSMLESMASLFIVPLFIVALTRKYLRTYY